MAVFEIRGEIKFFTSGTWIDKDIQKNGKYLGWFQQELIQASVSDYKKADPEFDDTLPPPSLKMPYKENSLNENILEELKKINGTLEYIYKNNR